MTPVGWAFIVVSWGAIFGLAAFCLRQTFKKKT